MKTVRCAIYTRKSSEEGLEQDFNSLDAQRESCSAYILSQASEGWAEIKERYDDGGLSGGTLDRPALQRLLSDVADGRIDIIVVYKVDRLTRSLLDFSKLVEAFDKAGTSFVSVTQSFNTTTSMGRLTLNMLLSFAQFEREVTAERIRDKIAASKAKGMWMGGIPPLGYEPDGRSLNVVEDHARLVRSIFDLYLELGNVRLVAERLDKGGVRSPTRVKTKSGQTYGGVPLSRGQIYGILKCPTYIGEVHHNGKVHPGLHAGIIDRRVWDAVQAKLAGNLQGHRSGERAKHSSLLAGKIVDAAGAPLVAVHATKGKVRYRYYVSRDLQEKTSAAGMRIPAREIEAEVREQVGRLFDDPIALMETVGLDVPASDIVLFHERCRDIAPRSKAFVSAVVTQVSVQDSGIHVSCSAAAIAKSLGFALAVDAPAVVTLQSSVRLTRTGKAMRLVRSDGSATSPSINQNLVKLLVKARRWWAMLRTGEIDLNGIERSEGANPAYVGRVIRLAFLSPKVVDAILTGRTLPGVDVGMLTAPDAIPACWKEQERRLLPG